MSMVLNAFSPAILTGMRLDPLTVEGSAVFSNNDKTIENALNPGFSMVKTAFARRTGKWYWEVRLDTFTSSTTPGTIMGFTRPDYNIDMITSATAGVGGQIWFSNASGNTRRIYLDGLGNSGTDIGVLAAGMVISFAVDLDAGLCWVRGDGGQWLGSATPDPATGTAGRSFGDLAGRDVTPYSILYHGTDKHTYRFEASEFSYAAPAGFLPWATDVTGADNADHGYATLKSVRAVTSNNVVYSNGDLTVTPGGGGLGTATFRTRDIRSRGKLYVEWTSFQWFPGTAPTSGVGIWPFQTSLANSWTDGAMYNAGGGGRIRVQGTTDLAAIGAPADYDIIRMAADLDNKLVWFARNGGNWNNDPLADPATGVGGFSFTFKTAQLGGTFQAKGSAPSRSTTLNAGQNAFTYSIPSGFKRWGVQNRP